MGVDFTKIGYEYPVFKAKFANVVPEFDILWQPEKKIPGDDTCGDDRDDDLGFLARLFDVAGRGLGGAKRCDANGCNPCHDQSGLISLTPSSFSSRTLSSSHRPFPLVALTL